MPWRASMVAEHAKGSAWGCAECVVFWQCVNALCVVQKASVASSSWQQGMCKITC